MQQRQPRLGDVLDDYCPRERREFDSLSLKEWRAASELFGDDVKEHITAQASVAAKRTPQSTQPAAVAAALAGVQAWLSRVTG